MAEVVLLAGAENDFFETYVRLELLNEELAERFSLHVDSTFKRLEAFPELGSVFCPNTRRVLVP